MIHKYIYGGKFYEERLFNKVDKRCSSNVVSIIDNGVF